MAETIRRITSTVGTIPAGTAMSGTVTTNTGNNKILNYTGTPTEITSLVNDGNNNWGGYTFLYAPSGTPKIRRLLGYSPLTGTTGSIFLDDTMTGLSGSSFQIIIGDLRSYSLTNDGGADGSVDGVTVVDGESIAVNPTPNADGIGALKTPVYVVATGTNFLISEQS